MKVYTNENYTFKVGGNASENDLLLTESSENDLWFHLQKFSSPHGILTNSEIGVDNVPTDILLWCAGLVKKSSSKKCKYLQNIGVNYIKVKYIQKTQVVGCVVLVKKSKVIMI